jgi:hypothetical protein
MFSTSHMSTPTRGAGKRAAKRDAPAGTPESGSLRAYPNIAAAAKMLGVSASTISRRADLARQTRGERDVVLAPREVLRLARIYRQRSVNEVAQDLLDHAENVDAGERPAVEAQVEEHFGEWTSEVEREQLLWLARRLLDPETASSVEAQLGGVAGEQVSYIQGYQPLAEED